MRIKISIEKRLDGWWYEAYHDSGPPRHNIVKGPFNSQEEAESAAMRWFPKDHLTFSTIVPMNY